MDYLLVICSILIIPQLPVRVTIENGRLLQTNVVADRLHV